MLRGLMASHAPQLGSDSTGLKLSSLSQAEVFRPENCAESPSTKHGLRTPGNSPHPQGARGGCLQGQGHVHRDTEVELPSSPAPSPGHAAVSQTIPDAEGHDWLKEEAVESSSAKAGDERDLPQL